MAKTRSSIKRISAETGLTEQAVTKALGQLGFDTTEEYLPISTRDAMMRVRQELRERRLGRDELQEVGDRCAVVERIEGELDEAKGARNLAIHRALVSGVPAAELVEVTGLSRAWVGRMRSVGAH